MTTTDVAGEPPATTLHANAKDHLRGVVDPEEVIELDGLSDQAWRERISNAVPPAAAEAIASVMGRMLLLAWAGESFMLSNDPIWVRPMAAALSVSQGAAVAASQWGYHLAWSGE